MIASIPKTYLKLARTLGILVRNVGAGVVGQGSDRVVVNQPDQAILVPIKTILVDCGIGIRDVFVGAAIPSGDYAFAKVICLDQIRLAEAAAAPFPVNLVKVIGDENDTADDARARRCLSPDIDFAKEEEEIGHHLRSITVLAKDDLSTRVVELNRSGIQRLIPTRRPFCGLGEVDCVIRLGKSRQG